MSRRKDRETGETILTPVVRRSWEMCGWIKNKPYSYKLQQIMGKEFSKLKLDSAVSRIYRNTWMKKGPGEIVQKVITLARVFSYVIVLYFLERCFDDALRYFVTSALSFFHDGTLHQVNPLSQF